MYYAFINTVEPKAQLPQSSKCSFSHSHYFDFNPSFHDSHMKLDVKFVCSPYVSEPMIKALKKLNASKLNI